MTADAVKPEEEQEETQQTGKREWMVRTGIDCLSLSHCFPGDFFCKNSFIPIDTKK